jgi:hypothetical protein
MAAGFAASLLTPLPLAAQQAAETRALAPGFWLTTPYPELAIKPGETESIDLTR